MRNYYDVADILAETERVPAQFQVDAMDVGYLVEGSQDRDVEVGTKTEMPYWLAEHLAQKQCISIDPPSFFSLKHRNMLLAAPRKVNLRQCCPVFYQLGMRVARWLGMDQQDQQELEEDLVKALCTRFLTILEHSQNSHNEDNTHFTNRLSEMELQLYWEGYGSAMDHLKWKRSYKSTLKRSWLVDLHMPRSKMKRRRLQ